MAYVLLVSWGSEQVYCVNHGICAACILGLGASLLVSRQFLCESWHMCCLYLGAQSKSTLLSQAVWQCGSKIDRLVCMGWNSLGFFAGLHLLYPTSICYLCQCFKSDENRKDGLSTNSMPPIQTPVLSQLISEATPQKTNSQNRWKMMVGKQFSLSTPRLLWRECFLLTCFLCRSLSKGHSVIFGTVPQLFELTWALQANVSRPRSRFSRCIGCGVTAVEMTQSCYLQWLQLFFKPSFLDGSLKLQQ